VPWGYIFLKLLFDIIRSVGDTGSANKIFKVFQEQDDFVKFSQTLTHFLDAENFGQLIFAHNFLFQ